MIMKSYRFLFLILTAAFIMILINCDSFDEDYLSHIFVKNNTVCILDIYLNDEFQFAISSSDNIKIIENVHLGYHNVSAYKTGTNEEVYSLMIYVFQHNRGYYFIIAEDLCY